MKHYLLAILSLAILNLLPPPAHASDSGDSPVRYFNGVPYVETVDLSPPATPPPAPPQYIAYAPAGGDSATQAVDRVVTWALAIFAGIVTVAGAAAATWAKISPFIADLRALKERQDRAEDNHDTLSAKVDKALMPTPGTANPAPVALTVTADTTQAKAALDDLHNSADALTAKLGIIAGAGALAAKGNPDVGMSTAAPIVPAAVGLILALLYFVGCALTPATQTALTDTWNTAYNGALAAGVSYLEGDKGQAVAQAAFTAATTGQQVNKLVSDAVTANGGTTAQAASLNALVNKSLAVANGKTSKAAALNTFGSALQTAVNQLAAPKS
jgi:hypothetical protein